MFISILLLLQVTWAVSLSDTHRFSDGIQVYESYSGRILSSEEHAEHEKRNTTLGMDLKKMLSADENLIINHEQLHRNTNSNTIQSTYTQINPLINAPFAEMVLSECFNESWCLNYIKPCDPFERRRLDGSCNNLRNPSRGAIHTPSYQVLPTVFDKGNQKRKSKNGKELPLSRKVRTTLLLEGRDSDTQFTHLVTHYSVFMSADILSFHDTINYMVMVNCCDERKGKPNPECVREEIPNDDPVHRFSNQRCQNLTRPWSFQSKGCVKNNTRPERIILTPTFFDLSQIYADNEKILNTKRRLFKGGLLKYEIEEGRMWPPSFKNLSSDVYSCLANQAPRETRCHDTGEFINNGIVGTNLFTIWMWRHHNYIATELSRINPCWDDERLFYTAKEINIAINNQIFYYELNPVLLGGNNLYQEGILSPNLGYRDVYDENIIPQISMEYAMALRWTHTIQEGTAKMYDPEGNYLKSIKIVDLTLRTGYLADQNNIDYLTQGAFRQAAAKIDKAIDPEIVESGLGSLQRINDIATSDLAKNRLIGFAPYVKYRKHCFGEIITSFEELKQAIEPEEIDLLKELYDNVEDIDLLAGMWVERPITGARVPATFYCLIVDQLKRSLVSDRHWYERSDRPNAFTIDQLLEIRKASIAGVLCIVGDKVTKIQPRAFTIPALGNEIRSCKKITSVNLEAWKDYNCDVENRDFNHL